MISAGTEFTYYTLGKLTLLCPIQPVDDRTIEGFILRVELLACSKFIIDEFHCPPSGLPLLLLGAILHITLNIYAEIPQEVVPMLIVVVLLFESFA
jgi:hypothetical protein